MKILLGFDGTLTDAKTAADLLARQYLHKIHASLGISNQAIKYSAIASDYLKARADVLNNPKTRPLFYHGGFVTCYPDEDPLIASRVAVTKLLQTNSRFKDVVLSTYGSIKNFLLSSYIELKDAAAGLREEDGEELFRKLSEANEVAIVTGILHERPQRIFPGVTVYTINPTLIDPHYNTPGLSSIVVEDGRVDRVIDLRRPELHDLLDRLKPDMVVGSCFSTELAVPHSRGIAPVLMKNDYTPDFASKAEGINVIKSLADLLK